MCVRVAGGRGRVTRAEAAFLGLRDTGVAQHGPSITKTTPVACPLSRAHTPGRPSWLGWAAVVAVLQGWGGRAEPGGRLEGAQPPPH